MGSCAIQGYEEHRNILPNWICATFEKISQVRVTAIDRGLLGKACFCVSYRLFLNLDELSSSVGNDFLKPSKLISQSAQNEARLCEHAHFHFQILVCVTTSVREPVCLFLPDVYS